MSAGLPCRFWSRSAAPIRSPARRKGLRRSFPALRPWSSPAAITCWRWATGPIRTACSNSCPSALKPLNYWVIDLNFTVIGSLQGIFGPPLGIGGPAAKYDRTSRRCGRPPRLAVQPGRYPMAQSQTKPAFDTVDPVWARLRREAEETVRREPELATFIYSTILHHDTLETAVVYRLAERLDHPALSGELIRQAYAEALKDIPALAETFRADLMATVDRDPATHRLIEPVLYYKGFHAIQTHRLMHWLWHKGRRDLALYLQSRSSAVFQCDIHPAAKIGRGIFLDHATGLVVGETAEIGDDVSILHDVTLGGTGKEWEDRHPKIRYGVMIGAGAKILGNIEVGHCARIAAGSVVTKPVPNNVTVAGVPAKVIGEAGCPEPARTMDQIFHDGI